jgi:hypothetical protein
MQRHRQRGKYRGAACCGLYVRQLLPIIAAGMLFHVFKLLHQVQFGAGVSGAIARATGCGAAIDREANTLIKKFNVLHSATPEGNIPRRCISIVNTLSLNPAAHVRF